MAKVVITDLTTKSGILHTSWQGGVTRNYNVNNYKAMIVGNRYSLSTDATKNPQVRIPYVALTQTPTTGYTPITSAHYNVDYAKDGHPTLNEFLDFYRSVAYLSSNLVLQRASSQVEGLLDFSEISEIFLSSSFEKSGTAESNLGSFPFTVSISGNWSFGEYVDLSTLTTDEIVKALLMEACLYSEPSKTTHYFYISGGEFGTDKDYSITEIVRTDTGDATTKWITSENSKAFYPRRPPDGDLVYYPKQKLLKTTKRALFTDILSANGFSLLKWNLTTFGAVGENPHYQLIPKYADFSSGSQFTGNQYTISFPDKLPNSADEVDNAWASVRQVGATTEANNEVVVLYGTPPEAETPDEQTREDIQNDPSNKGDSPSKDLDPNDIDWGDKSGSGSELTKIYELTNDQVRLFANELWSQSYENVLKIQDNPIENIISIKKFPFTKGSTLKNIKVGNVTFSAQGSVVSSGVHEMRFPTTGSVAVSGKFASFLDGDTTTKCKIILPYCGEYELPLSEIIDHSIAVKYLIDIVHGDCCAIVLVDDYPLYTFNGNMGVNVPVTQTDRVTAESKHMMNVASGVTTGAMSGGVGGAVASGGLSAITSGLNTYSSNHTASGSGAVNVAMPQNIRLIFVRPQTPTYKSDNKYQTFPQGYAHNVGYMYNAYGQLNTFSGFVKVGGNVDVSNIIANQQIKDRIVEKLKGGVYI